MKALTGIKVIDFSKWLPGQYCGMVLGDFGADVIKVETPTGDDTRRFFPEALPGMSYWHLALNRNFITSSVRSRCIFRRLPAGLSGALWLGLRNCQGNQPAAGLLFDHRLWADWQLPS